MLAISIKRDRNVFNKYIRKRETPMQIIILSKRHKIKIIFKCGFLDFQLHIILNQEEKIFEILEKLFKMMQKKSNVKFSS